MLDAKNRPAMSRGPHWQVELDVAHARRLERVGYWGSREEPTLPDPVAHVDASWGDDERAAVLAYLVGAPSCGHWMGYATCRLCGVSGPELGDSDLTDGVWIWPEGFAHYVRAHAVRPPGQFLEHVRAAQYRLRGPIIPLEDALARLPAAVVAGMNRIEDAGNVLFRLAHPASPRDLYLGVEVDRELGCYRVELNPAAIERRQHELQRKLNPSFWRRVWRDIFG